MRKHDADNFLGGLLVMIAAGIGAVALGPCCVPPKSSPAPSIDQWQQPYRLPEFQFDQRPTRDRWA